MATAAASSLSAKVLPSVLPKSSPFLRKSGTLYQVLSGLPKDGVGLKVSQSRWGKKGISDSYWEITRVRLKDEGNHGKAWGKLVWRGKPLHENDTLIRQGLKYAWKEEIPTASAS